jgi:lipopolysaccharide export system permease protein
MRIPGLRKLDIYIMKKFLGTFFLSIILIISIAVVFDLAEKLDDFMENNAPTRAIIFDYYLNFIPYFVNLFSYLFTFIAVIFFTSRMAYQTEIIAILSNAVSYKRMLLPYFISACIIAGMNFFLTNWVIPPANEERFAFEEQFYRSSPYRYTERNIHKQIEPNVYIYMESYSNTTNTGYKFSSELFEDDELKSKLISDFIRWDTAKKTWVVYNYYIRTFDGLEESIESGRRLDTMVNLNHEAFKKRKNVVEAMGYKELNEYIEQLEMQGSTRLNVVLIEKSKRFAGPFSTFILTLLGVSVSSRKVRGGMGGHLGIGVAISFSYIFFMQFASQFAISGLMSPMLAAWVPNIVFAVVAVFMYRMAPK